MSYTPQPDGGAVWLQAYRAAKPDAPPLSELALRVADLLGELYHGLYHLEHAVKNATWDEPVCVTIAVPASTFATFDFDGLTQLVFLAHEYCLRVQVSPGGPNRLSLMFHPRQREGRISERHPTLEQALAQFRDHHPERLGAWVRSGAWLLERYPIISVEQLTGQPELERLNGKWYVSVDVPSDESPGPFWARTREEAFAAGEYYREHQQWPSDQYEAAKSP